MSLNPEQTRCLVISAMQDVIEQREYLNALDRALGDGDHGTTVARGASGAIAALNQANATDVNELFALAGRAMMKSMGGASGVLFGTFFQGAEHCPKSRVLDTPTLLLFFKSGLNDLQKKTKATVGDKTIVDSIVPLINELEHQGAAPLCDALVSAANAAEKGAGSTVGLVARFGRARTLGERAASTQDPGATSLSFFFRALANHVRHMAQSPPGCENLR